MCIIKNLIKYIKGDLPMSKKVTVEGNKVVIEGVTDEEIKNLIGHTNLKELGNVAPGKVIKVGAYEFKVLEHLEEGTAVLMKKCFDGYKPFDEHSNNWTSSDLRNYLNTDFYKLLSAEIGAENIIEHMVDLTTEDGLKDFGIVTDKISLLTTDMYRKYRKEIGENLDCWWWTVTANSNDKNSNCVRAVYDCGLLGSYYDNDGGVRPFCILKSNILVSEVEE